jgi:hypothetical protein
MKIAEEDLLKNVNVEIKTKFELKLILQLVLIQPIIRPQTILESLNLEGNFGSIGLHGTLLGPLHKKSTLYVRRIDM